MKRSSLKATLAGIVALAILLSCLLTGLVLPVMAADAVTASKFVLEVPSVHIMTGRYRNMSGTVTFSDDSTKKYTTKADMSWTIADTSIATIDDNGRITPLKIGKTTLTATTPAGVVDSSGNRLTKTIDLTVIDGSEYVYFNTEYTLDENNVIANGDFEAGYTGSDWVLYAAGTVEKPQAVDFAAGVGKDGSAGLQLKSAADWQSNRLNSHVKAGNVYLLSFDYLANKGNIFSIYGANLSISTTEFDLTGSKGTGTWKTYTKLIKMPYTNSGNRNLIIYGKTVNSEAPVVIDNVSLREYKSAMEIDELILNHTSKKMTIGQSFRMEALTDPFGGDLNNLVWSTTDDSVVTAEGSNGASHSNDIRISYGLVKAVGEGTAIVTATTADGAFSASCTITVSGGKGGSLMADSSLDAMNKKAWTKLDGNPVKFVANGGAEGSAALVVDRYQPVSHSFTGLKPNTTYTLQGVAKTNPTGGYVVVTVVNGSQTLVTVNDKYTGWGATESGEAQLAAGVKFTTPATLESNTTTVHIGVLLSNEDKAPVLVTAAAKAANRAGSGKIEMGEGEITDDEEDTTECSAYIDCLDIYKEAVVGVDLTPTYVQWKGDANNDGQVTPGTQITFEVPVKNVGTDDLPAGDSFVIEIAADREVIRTIKYSGGIPAGKTVVVTDTAPWTAVAGDYMLSARVNANYDVLESNPDTNQTYQINLRVANDVYTPAYNSDIIAQAGMDRLTLSDDFNNLSSVDTLASGDEGYKWYVTRPWGAGRLLPHDYKVENGVLTLMSEHPTYGIALNSVDMITNNGYRYKHGYLEVRLRIPRPTDNDDHETGVPTVWSFTEDKAMENITGNDKNWVELDWLEYWGNTNQYPGGYYTTTFHQSTTEETTPSYSNSNHSLEGLGDAEWHVMGWLWENNKIRTFLDGKEMMNMFIDADSPLVPAPRVNKEGIGSKNDTGIFSWANLEEAVLYLGGSKDNPELIDYIRIWQASEPETVSDNMTMERTEITMDERTREQLNVIVPEGEDVGTLNWNTSDPKVATVHGNGEVYARGQGKAVITANNANGTTVFCTVTVEHNLFTNGDFEDDNDLLHKSLEGMLKGDGYEIVDDGTGNRAYSIKHDSSGSNGGAVKYFMNWSAKKNTTYVLSGRWKGPSNMYVYFHGSYCQATGNSKTGDVSLGGRDTDGDGWKEFSLEFTTGTGSLNDHYIFGFRNKYGSTSYSKKTAYLDDLKLVEKTNVKQSSYTLTVDAMENGSVTLKNGSTTLSSGASVTPGTLISVTVKPASGYQLKLGSLTYAYTLPSISGGNAHERKVLNKNSTTFGADTSNTFQFVMPEEDTTLSALFESAATATDSIVATLGTSMYVEDEKISGVRFLNRMYYTRMDDSGVYVMYNGVEHKVNQFGTLLKRSTNDGELTLAAYDEHKNDSSATRIWKSEGLRYGNVYLVDYTNNYIDFTITMTSSVGNRYSFLSRGYTVCGYVVLDDGTTVYTEAFTDSVMNAYNRSL